MPSHRPFDPMDDLQRALDAARGESAPQQPSVHDQLSPADGWVVLPLAPKPTPPPVAGAVTVRPWRDDAQAIFDKVDAAGGTVLQIGAVDIGSLDDVADTGLAGVRLASNIVRAGKRWYVVVNVEMDAEGSDVRTVVLPWTQLVHGFWHLACDSRCNNGTVALKDDTGGPRDANGDSVLTIVRRAFDQLNHRKAEGITADELRTVGTALAGALNLLDIENNTP